MIKKMTITIGIPAYNEEQNIEILLDSIMSQKKTNWKFDLIIVILDGSTDSTFKVLSKISQKYSGIKIVRGKKRLGKAYRLNQIFNLSNSECLLLLDADVKLGTEDTIRFLVSEFNKHQGLLVGAALLEPFASNSFIGRINSASYVIWNHLISNYKSGDNIHCLMGCATMLRKSFYKSFLYPQDVVTDQHYLYASVKLVSKHGFSLIRNTKVLFRMPSTLRDSRILGARAIFDDKDDLKNRFGEKILDEYKIPIAYKVKLVIWALTHMPIYFIESIILGIFVRCFPLRPSKKTFLWTPIVSSKTAIL